MFLFKKQKTCILFMLTKIYLKKRYGKIKIKNNNIILFKKKLICHKYNKKFLKIFIFFKKPLKKIKILRNFLYIFNKKIYKIKKK